ncbi:MAG TPA: S-adenosylmethionine decarboxylase [Bryobacteraceae bacterium]|nr:S-adenosylmethionine decarboxylase [Bryobacteraceae bacterium]
MSGLEWIVEAHGCDRAALADLGRLKDLFRKLIQELELHPLGKSNWHQFPNTGGITGVSLLSESHLACHTFPEYGSLCLNLFCCRPRPATDFESLLVREFGAAKVCVRQVERPYQP